MSEAFRVMSVDEIYRWVANASSQGITMRDLALLTGLPTNTFIWMKYGAQDKLTRRMSAARRMLLSKSIADIEHGKVRFERGPAYRGCLGSKTIIVRPDKPVPLPPKLHLDLTGRTPRLRLDARPDLIPSLPTLRGIKLTPR